MEKTFIARPESLVPLALVDTDLFSPATASSLVVKVALVGVFVVAVMFPDAACLIVFGTDGGLPAQGLAETGRLCPRRESRRTCTRGGGAGAGVAGCETRRG